MPNLGDIVFVLLMGAIYLLLQTRPGKRFTGLLARQINRLAGYKD